MSKVPSIQILTKIPTPFEWFMYMYMYKTWMEGTYDIANKNP